MPKYEDVVDLYDDCGKRIAKDVPLEAISPLRNNAIKKIVSLTKRTVAVNLAGIEKALKTGSMTGGGVVIKGKEIDIPLVENADKIAEIVKNAVQVYDGDDTVVKVKSGGKNLVVIVPEDRMNAGVEYTTGFTVTAAATTEAIIDTFDVPMYKANMVKAAVWGRYPQTITFQGANVKSILEVPQNNEGAGFALRNIMANHVVSLVNRNAMQALSAIFEQCGSYEMGDTIGNFERGALLSLAYEGLNANNMVYTLVKKNGKTGTVGTVIESLMGRAIDDGVIRVKETLPSGYKVYTTDDLPKWNAYAAAGMVAAVMVNVGAARAAQGVPSTILYYNDLLEHESGLPGVDYGRAEGVGVGMSFFSHSIYGGGGPGLFHGNHVVTRHAKGVVIPAITAGNCLDGGTQTFSAEATSGLFKEVFGDIEEFSKPMQYVAAEAKKVKKKL